MKIKFIGVPGESHDSLHMYGKDYPLDVFVETTDALAIKKMSNHPHFECEAEETAEPGNPQEVSDGNTDGPGDSSAPKVGKPRGRRNSKRA